MAYFVTGATGFIGRNLLERLLERDGDIYLLVRPGSQAKFDALVARYDAAARLRAVSGDLTESRLGLAEEDLAALTGRVEHFFHLAAVYDMTADDETNRRANVTGTRHAVDLANALGAGRFHHVSSVAVAGTYQGYFREDMFDEGQVLPSPYHQTKFESERIVRSRTKVPWRVYRPSVVVGHSKTGEMDKIDGPYYFFKAIQRVRHLLPEWVPLVGPELGFTNIVPVDFVAAAIDHIAHAPGLDGQAFHLTAPRSQRSGEVFNAFLAAAHGPRIAMRIDKRLTDALPKGALSMLLKVPALKQIRRNMLADLGIPEEVVANIPLVPRFDTRDAERALADAAITAPPLESYAATLWDYWERNLDPDLFKDRSLSGALNGRTVIVTGASTGIGRAAAIKIASYGGIPILVARSLDKLDETKSDIEDAGGTAYIYAVDLASIPAIEAFIEHVLADHPRIDMLVNNAGRSIRRSAMHSLDRFHDYERTMALNYFGAVKLILGLLPHWRATGGGHVLNVSSIGAQAHPPRFSAYVASKAALDSFTTVVASEVINYGITFTTVHMPLVRTAMTAPTKMYEAFPLINADEAADMICEGLRSKPKEINTRLGTFGEVAQAIAPKAVDQILHMMFKAFPDSSAAVGGAEGPPAEASNEAVALAHLMKGIYW
jgi:NAD(P)-dependent dehydrogenase (short-subunit alcohol dehydrogenase family)